MHYFRVEQAGVVTNKGAILVTFWNHGHWNIASRHKEGYAQMNICTGQKTDPTHFPVHYGLVLPITEADALAADPGLFQEAFLDYEEYKVYEREQLLLQQKQHTPKKGQRNR